MDTHEEHKAIKLGLREQESLDLREYDAIIHLAALSNDPLGEINQNVTFSVNRDTAIKLAVRARNQGVSRFVFVSKQSIYGISDSLVELREDAPKNPITAYARSKWDAEQEILGMSTKNFSTVTVRPSTVFGWGSRIRNDIIFNNMILSGLKSGKIEVQQHVPCLQSLYLAKENSTEFFQYQLSCILQSGFQSKRVSSQDGWLWLCVSFRLLFYEYLTLIEKGSQDPWNEV